MQQEVAVAALTVGVDGAGEGGGDAACLQLWARCRRGRWRGRAAAKGQQRRSCEGGAAADHGDGDGAVGNMVVVMEGNEEAVEW
ncbi:hypothetical protein M0R45_035489 [Rubus argutus]|uniref:Uncharacterized protein n=1 Tax=Rubus argutus TaxID=59490 RepID=A0AAW1VTB6_RUBAR